MLAFRDPIHGFIRTDALETALIQSAPMQRLRFVRQLGLSFLVFPGAEHSRFSHVLGTLHLAGRLYDSVALKSGGHLPVEPRCRERRLVRAAALLHDIGHAPFSHSAEDLFEDGIDHEEMTRRLLHTPEMERIFAEHGDGIRPGDVARILAKEGDGTERLLSEIITSDLDVDKMDYLLRDSLYCGVRYGSYDLERLLDTIIPLEDKGDGRWHLGVDHGGVHALEALVMARYYMFTQVYFNPVSKVMELHFNQWLRSENRRWSADPEIFLEHDDVTIQHEMRASTNPHARAIIHRERYTLAFETEEHLDPTERDRFKALVPRLRETFGHGVLVDHSAKDPHRLAKSRVLVKRSDSRLVPMSEASDFIAHLSRIESFRVYAEREKRDEVARTLGHWWHDAATD